MSSITNCVFSGNTAGVYATASSPTVLNCVFTDNTATLAGGGGMLTAGGSPLVRNCTMVSNAAVRGGGLALGSGTVTNTIVRGNTAPTLPDLERLGGSITFSNLGLWFLPTTPNADGNFNADRCSSARSHTTSGCWRARPALSAAATRA